MTIEITSPEVEALIRQRMQAGSFGSAEDLLREVLRSSAMPERRTGADLIAAMRACPHPEADIEPPRVLSPLVRHVTLWYRLRARAGSRGDSGWLRPPSGWHRPRGPTTEGRPHRNNGRGLAVSGVRPNSPRGVKLSAR